MTRVTLFTDIPRIDIRNEILSNFGDVKTWSYSFNVDSPDVWHEEVGAVIRAKLLAGGGHYSPRNARYDWLTLNHFADVTNSQTGNSGITLSNADAYFMKLGASTSSALDTTTPQINVLAGGQVLGSGLGIPAQGGDNYFMQRFALQPHGQFSQADAMKFALEHQNPLITGGVSGVGEQARPYPAGTYSFLNLSDPNVLLWALKPAEDGIERGIVARVWNQSDSPASYFLQLALPITGADKVTHIETFVEKAAVAGGRLSAVANQQQIQTHLLRIR